MKRKTVAVLLLAALLGGLMSACAADGGETLTAAFLNIGKADAILLRCGGETLVIDTGESEDGRKLLKALEEEGAQRVDTLIITHFDRDHVGGAALLAEKLPIGRVLLPDYESDREEYGRFLQALDAAGITPERLRESVRFSLGGAEVLVEPPPTYLEEVGDNDRSLITTVTFGSRRLVFMGDSEKQRTRRWLADCAPVPCDFVKLPHHGVYDKSLPELLAALKPRWAVVCDSDKNPAEEETLAALAEAGVRLYRTAEGEVRLTCDGKTITLSQGT